MICTQHRASRNFGSTLGRDVEFGSHGTGLDASLGIVTCFSGIDAGCATLAVDELDGRVAVFFDGLDLRDPVTGNIDDGDRNAFTIISKDSHHSDLSAQQTKSGTSLTSGAAGNISLRPHAETPFKRLSTPAASIGRKPYQSGEV